MNRPNIRKMFIPDPGMVFVEFDLAGADAQVVAWEAGDESLKTFFKQGKAIHLQNALDIYEEEITKKDPRYAKVKKGVHLTNYKGGEEALRLALNGTAFEARLFRAKWFSLHPAIPAWHVRTEHILRTVKYLTTPFGRRLEWPGRYSHETLSEGLAFVPQSTVADVINRGLLNVWANMRDRVFLLGQVHDSLLMQVVLDDLPNSLQMLNENMRIVVPYPDPLIIPLEAKVSERSWGEVREVKLIGMGGVK